MAEQLYRLTNKIFLSFSLLFLLQTVAAKPHDRRPARKAAVKSMAVKSPIPDEVKSLVTKYASLLKTDEAHVNKFLKLYSVIDYWMGTRYLWGGCSKSGIDCSCFVQKLFSQTFNIQIKRTSLAQFCDRDVALFTNRNEYQLGDLIFFKTSISRETRNNRVTHVGFYLTNGYFVQSSSAGVNIASLNRGFWKTRIVAAGRLRESFYKKAGIAIPTGDTRSETDKLDVGEEDSDFEPIPYPEDLDSTTTEYATLLNIEKDKIRIPEVFEFIEKNRYAPLNITSRCPRNPESSNCLSTALFSDVFSISFAPAANPVFLANNTVEMPGKEKADAKFLDIVVMKAIGKVAAATYFNGIYLYNGYFLHLHQGDLAIASINDPAFKGYSIRFHRFNEDILKKALANVVEKRSGPKPAEKKTGDAPVTAPPKTQPANLLKKDGAPADTPAVQPADEPEPAAETPRKKKRRKKQGAA